VASEEGTNPLPNQFRGSDAALETTRRLLERAQEGDHSAAETLFARCLLPLRRWARGRLPSHARDLADTHDLVQDALLQTFKRLEAFDARGSGAFQAYLRQAVMNRILDEIRRAGRRRTHLELDSGIPANDASPLDEAIGRDAVERYERALGHLKNEDRDAIILRIELGLSYEEVTEALGKTSIGAARKCVERAIIRLAAEMDRAGS
jgi:RNA polymerase sigma-70 factor (ECF subfamily)